MNRLRMWIPYLWAIPLALVPWVSTIVDFPVVYFATFVGYTITLVACHDRAFSVHQLVHLLVFEVVTLVVWFISVPDSITYLMFGIPGLSAWGIVLVGGIILAVIRVPAARRKPPKDQA